MVDKALNPFYPRDHIMYGKPKAKGINGEGRQKNNHPFSYDMCARGWIKLTVVVVSSYICCIYTR